MKVKLVVDTARMGMNSEPDHLQNLVYDQLKGVDADALADDLRKAPEYIPIPDYAFDCHTRKGKASGATKAQFFSAEHAALQPFQPGLFDDLVDG